MKNVLFATTALVAMTGSAFAAAHGAAGASVSFSGELTAGYNDVINGGLFWEANLDLGASVDFGDNVTASVDVTIADWANGAAGTTSNATVEVAYTGDTLSASLKMGDLGDKGASEYFYSDRDGMNVDVENHDATADARALIEFGSFGVAVGCQVSDGTGIYPAGECLGMNVGVGATFGSIELGVGYDDGANGQATATAVSADATFGALSFGVSYIDGSTSVSIKDLADTNDADKTVNPGATTFTALQNSTAVELGYDISDALSVGVYYAANSVDGDSYGMSASYSAGALSLSAYFDHSVVFGATLPVGVDVDGDGFFTGGQTPGFVSTDSYGLDLGYDVSSQLTLNAGLYDDGTFVYYVGVDFAVNDNITATLSYATANEISGPEYKDGITALITATF